ncbi:hypothetical protein J4H92_03070 [Leucobacter weissii]|uniref:Glycine zipper-like domain-containing protein n=1 Tax=Leucobacter weissii TaxID=1983706 RepID=A0A939SB05_9MICO|nr:hypothetical protein [Leucobacter weissii]MBO1900928.1 hypothetical protein [Leucobacter weissii]
MTGTEKPEKASDQTGLALGLALGVGVGVALGVATDQLGTWMAIGIALGLVFGLSYDARRRSARAASDPGNEDPPPVKIVDGATYTLVRRDDPPPGRRAHCWLGDNGWELELAEEEAARYGVD